MAYFKAFIPRYVAGRDFGRPQRIILQTNFPTDPAGLAKDCLFSAVVLQGGFCGAFLADFGKGHSGGYISETFHRGLMTEKGADAASGVLSPCFRPVFPPCRDSLGILARHNRTPRFPRVSGMTLSRRCFPRRFRGSCAAPRGNRTFFPAADPQAVAGAPGVAFAAAPATDKAATGNPAARPKPLRHARFGGGGAFRLFGRNFLLIVRPGWGHNIILRRSEAAGPKLKSPTNRKYSLEDGNWVSVSVPVDRGAPGSREPALSPRA
jgi:hypothetical protein